MEADIPPRIPKNRRKCQNSAYSQYGFKSPRGGTGLNVLVETLKPMIEAAMPMDPGIVRRWISWASKIGPDK
jgi:hypothetical protein